MPSFTTPARGRFPRSSIPGRIPDRLAPGSFGINWPDRKLYVGDPGGVPLLFTSLLRDWQLGAAYAEGDVIIHDGEIYVANQPVPANEPFDPADWTKLTSNTASQFGEPVATGLITGGQISMANAAELAVAAGAGVIVKNDAPANLVYTEVSWPAFSITVPMTGLSQHLSVTVNAAGAVTFYSPSALTEAIRRDVILLGFVRTSAAAISEVIDLPLPVAQTGETYRDEYQINGGPYRAEGATIYAPAANLSLAITAGRLFAIGAKFRTTPGSPNISVVSAANPRTFSSVDRDYDTVGVANLVQPTFWDNAGAITAVPAGKATIQYMRCRPGGTDFVIQIGQKLYDSLSEAAAALPLDYESFVSGPSDMERVLLAAIVVLQSATDLKNPEHGFVIPSALGGNGGFQTTGGGGGGGGGAAVDLTPYYKRDGSMPMTGAMDMAGFAILNAVLDGGSF